MTQFKIGDLVTTTLTGNHYPRFKSSHFMDMWIIKDILGDGSLVEVKNIITGQTTLYSTGYITLYPTNRKLTMRVSLGNLDKMTKLIKDNNITTMMEVADSYIWREYTKVNRYTVDSYTVSIDYTPNKCGVVILNTIIGCCELEVYKKEERIRFIQEVIKDYLEVDDLKATYWENEDFVIETGSGKLKTQWNNKELEYGLTSEED